MGEVSSEGERCDASKDLCGGLYEHILDGDLGDGAIACSDQEVAIGEDVECADSLREELVAWSDSLEVGGLHVDLHDVSSGGSGVDVVVIGVDCETAVRSLDVTQIAGESLNLFVLLFDSQQLDVLFGGCD